MVLSKGICHVELSLSWTACNSQKYWGSFFVLSNRAKTFCILILPSCLDTAYIHISEFIHWPSSIFLSSFLPRSFVMNSVCFPFDWDVHQQWDVQLHATVWSGVLFLGSDRWPTMLTINIHWDRRGRRLKHWQFVPWHPNGKSLQQAYRTHFLSSPARAVHSLLEADIS